MKKFFLAIAAVGIALSTLTFNSCKTEEPNKGPEGIAQTINSGEVVTLKAGEDYLLNGPLIVEAGGLLKIEAGTTIKAKKGFGSYILVLQDGKIEANGTADKPIIITADNETGATAGYWGGVIINGNAPLTSSQKTAKTEVNAAYNYGGDKANDNSGVLKYVAIKYSGARSSADVEHNGLTLNGVGNGTIIENVYVYECADDGIEFFGGSVNVTNLLVVNTDDDMFDFTQGYNGTLKNAYGVWAKGFTSSEDDPRGIEADGNFDGNFTTDTHMSDFVVENMTIDLRLDFNTGKTTQMQDVLKIRRGAKATIKNALVKGTGSVADLVDLTDGKGDGNPASTIEIKSTLTTPAARAFNGVILSPVTEGPGTGCATNLFGWTGYAL